MIIDLILDRYHGYAYDAKEFYDAVMDYEEGTNYPISRALDLGEEADVRRELCAYIDNGQYNPNIKNFINSVMWLEDDDGKDYSQIIDILAEEKAKESSCKPKERLYRSSMERKKESLEADRRSSVKKPVVACSICNNPTSDPIWGDGNYAYCSDCYSSGKNFRRG